MGLEWSVIMSTPDYPESWKTSAICGWESLFCFWAIACKPSGAGSGME
jgi:hypothetical protein